MSEPHVKRLFLSFAASFALLAGCTPPSPPIVDKAGVDEAKYSRDLADCYKNMPGFAVGNPVTSCMKDRGYRILYGA